MIDFCNKVNETSVHHVKILVGQQKGKTSYNMQTKHPISSFKKEFFTKKKENRFSFYLNFILNHSAFHCVCIKWIKKIEKNWNNKSREQILLNLTC
jgi:hypothetical protein